MTITEKISGVVRAVEQLYDAEFQKVDGRDTTALLAMIRLREDCDSYIQAGKDFLSKVEGLVPKTATTPEKAAIAKQEKQHLVDPERPIRHDLYKLTEDFRRTKPTAIFIHDAAFEAESWAQVYKTFLELYGEIFMESTQEGLDLRSKVVYKTNARKHLPVVVGKYAFATGYSARDTVQIIRGMLPYVNLTESDIRIQLQKNP